MSIGSLVFLLSVLLFGLFTLTALSSILRRLQKRELKKLFSHNKRIFFYRSLHLFFFPKNEYEGLFFANTVAQNLVRFVYAIASLFLLSRFNLITFNTENSTLSLDFPIGFINLIGLFLIFFLVGDYFPRILGIRYPEASFKISALLASILMTVAFPLTFALLKLTQLFSQTFHFKQQTDSQAEAKQQIIDLIQESDVDSQLDLHDKKLFESAMAFRDRIAREVMVPRVDVFSLPEETTIEDAANLIIREGYSRTPVYKDSLDNIVGVLMYKDILAKYMEYVQKGNDKKILKTPISTLVKGVLYTPETKKISQLLQEFRKKQVHLAITVDEYGGTEGIVTIEDILEEIVGDIADEYDQEEALFIPLPHGGWLVDARMGILDIEEQLGIEIPQEGDYDTLGGYIFHETGMIPTKGYIIRQPSFELEVLRSNNRRVEKVRLQPTSPEPQDDISFEEEDES